ncbi:mitochondrial processing peptidase alpha subunit [Perkinsela sp. CCAP 1560/4]|nr:mitochondrial processing peptidase alpha subunit [Perkinsela sp. CCAP 1560/4]|eukprot:KNH05880.1 mitochondrial processing peptidase alpha subunit [Perkinsela sp. CCAP 1560/4]
MMRRVGLPAIHVNGIRMISSFDVHPTMVDSFGKQSPVTITTPRDTAVTVLSNGTRVITHDFDGPNTAIGLYVPAGAKNDPSTFPGMNYALRWCFLSSNIDNSQFQVDKSFRSVGASYEHSELQKKLLSFKLEASRETWKEPFSHMLSCMIVPRFAQTEILKVQDAMENATEEHRWKSPREWCIEQVEQVAFKGEPLGNPRHITPYFVDELTSARMQEQWCRTFKPDGVTITGVNVDHNDLVMHCEAHPFSHDASAPHFKQSIENTETREHEMYQGGNELEFQEKREKEMSTKPFLENETIGALTWKSHGTSSLPEYASALVLRQILAISLREGLKVHGGPVNYGIESFYVPFAKVGLMGVTFREKTGDALDAIKSSLKIQSELNDQIVVKSIVESAKSRAKLRLFHDHIELRRDYIDFLTLFHANEPKKDAYKSIISAIDAVKVSDLKQSVAYANSTSPCMYTMGDVYGIPSLRQLGFNRDKSKSQIEA